MWAVLRDGRYLAFTALNAVLSLTSPLMEIALPLWITRYTHAPTWLFSVLVLLNTSMVVLGQVRISSRGRHTTDWSRAARLAGVFLGRRLPALRRRRLGYGGDRRGHYPARDRGAHLR